jgi:hypothetical protein
MGSVPQRTAMGNRARGLQPIGRRLELLQPRSSALSSLSLGRRRPRRNLGRQAAALLFDRPVEWAGSNHQRAPVRPDEQRGESRRGREGVLLLSRLDADPFVHEVPLQVPSGRVPLRSDRQDQRDPRPARARVRAARYGRVRRRSLFRRVRGIREGVSRGRVGRDQRHQPRP